MRAIPSLIAAAAVAALAAGPAHAMRIADHPYRSLVVAVPLDLRGEAVRTDGTTPHAVADRRGDAARAAGEAGGQRVVGTVADRRGDAARAAGEARTPVVIDVRPPVADGIDWTSVGLGAGGGLALAAISAGGVVLVSAARPRRS
jgi:hypothetical protein